MNMTPHEFIDRFPDACDRGRQEILRYPTMRDWWQATDRADWMLWCVERLTAERDKYTCADLARLWAAEVLARAGIRHGLRECSPIVDRETALAAAWRSAAAEAAAEAAAAEEAAWAEEAEAAWAAWAAEAAEAAAAAAWAAEAEEAAWAAAWAAEAAEAEATDVRARIACPFQDGE